MFVHLNDYLIHRFQTKRRWGEFSFFIPANMHREQEIVQIFKNLAANTADRYAINIQATTTIQGSRPPFDELMQLLQQLDKELTSQGVKLLESYKASAGQLPETLTDKLKGIITETIEQFVKKL
ncbi:hypothetical protein CAP35_13405 [Chitinophagaceae bacterium IBVUCB1]|nr:hypothetical protein CAP35_13405 [Chitinophagaceae bacterium IBVUCB1]